MNRSTEQRVADSLQALSSRPDVWVATANHDAMPHMVPFSLHWDGEHVIIATDPASVTVRNLIASPNAKLSVGDSTNVVLIAAEVTSIVDVAESGALIEQFAARTRWNPKNDTDSEMVFVTLTPTTVRAWRDVAEISGRTIMRDKNWLQ